MKKLLYGAALLAAAVVPTFSSAAEPAVVFGASSANELLGDVNYVTEAAGAPDFGRMATLMAGPFLEGIDKTKPWGGYVFFDGDEPRSLGFVPVTDLKAVLNTLRDNVGAPRDLGNGVMQVGQPPVFIKEKAGWAFVAQSEADLSDLPADPEKIVRQVTDDYDIGAKVFVRNIPENLRDMAVSELKSGFEGGIQGELGDDPVNRRLAENGIKSLISYVEESESISFGVSIDSMAKSIHLDVAFTAVPGTNLARRFATLSGNTSGYTGFLMPDAAVTANMSGALHPDDIEQMTLLLSTARERAMEELENDGNLPAAKKAQAKEVLSGMLDVLDKTVASGKIDGGAALLLKPGSITFAGGAYVADGKTFEASFRKFVELAKDEPNFPGVKFNADSHGGIDFHTMAVPIPAGEAEAREFFGEKLDIALGVGEKSVYVAAGKDSIATLKKVIDQSASGGGKAVPPAQLTISLAPIMKFVSSTIDDPIVGMLASAVERSAGKDHIKFTTTAIPNGSQTRIELEDGVLKLIGEAAKMAGAAGGGGPGFGPDAF